MRLRHSIPYDAFAVFVIAGDTLLPRFVLGENFRQLSSLRIPVGQGLAGWVAETGKCIVNGNPSVEPGYTEGPNSTALRSAIAMPLRGTGGTSAVLALYHSQSEAFSSDHLRSLETQSAELGRMLEKCQSREQASSQRESLAFAASASGPM